MTIRLADEFGAVLVGRTTAERLRAKIEDAARTNREGVTLDFEGILTVSPSFADELFAKVDATLLDCGAIRVKGLSPALESIRRFVIAGRVSEAS